MTQNQAVLELKKRMAKKTSNNQLKTVNIKGKDYVEVSTRVAYFRANYPNWSIITEIISLCDGVIVMRANILDENRNTVATGTAYENESSSFINKTSYIEVCETSAIGRALGFLGIGIEAGIASKEEVENAILNQNINSDTDKCPICGGEITKPALEKWGMCAKCKTKHTNL